MANGVRLTFFLSAANIKLFFIAEIHARSYSFLALFYPVLHVARLFSNTESRVVVIVFADCYVFLIRNPHYSVVGVVIHALFGLLRLVVVVGHVSARGISHRALGRAPVPRFYFPH